METTDDLRESLALYTCDKHLLHAFMSENGTRIIILCCCKPFNYQLKKDIESAMGEDYVRNKLRFVTGVVDYV